MNEKKLFEIVARVLIFQLMKLIMNQIQKILKIGIHLQVMYF